MSALLYLLGYWLVVALVVAVEARLDGGASVERKDRWFANAGLAGIGIAAQSAVPTGALAAALVAGATGGALLDVSALPWPLAAVTTVVIYTFVQYAIHVASHRVPMLWALHRIHHCDTELDASTGLRHHPGETLWILAVVTLVAGAFGLDPGALAVWGLVDAGFAIFTHMRTPLGERAELMLRKVIVTPRIHELHHSAYHRETDTNYGNVLILWDRLFGTYLSRSRREVPLRVGLREVDHDTATDLLALILRVPRGVRRMRPGGKARPSEAAKPSL